MMLYGAPFRLKLMSPMGTHEIVVENMMTDALYIKGCNYLAQLILLDWSEFDIILGMD